MALSVDLVAAARVQRAVRKFSIDGDEDALASTLWAGIPAFAMDSFGGPDARAAAHLVRERWRDISNDRDTYPAVLAGRAQRRNMPFDVKGVTKLVLQWADNLVEERNPDDGPMGWPTAAEIARAYGVSRATAYRLLHATDLDEPLAIHARAIRRKTVKQLVANGRTLAAARNLLDRRPELVGDHAAAPAPRGQAKLVPGGRTRFVNGYSGRESGIQRSRAPVARSDLLASEGPNAL
jgi:hypothetical protein